MLTYCSEDRVHVSATAPQQLSRCKCMHAACLVVYQLFQKQVAAFLEAVDEAVLFTPPRAICAQSVQL